MEILDRISSDQSMVAKNFIPLLEEEQVNSSKKTKLANNNESDVVSIGHSLNGNKYVSLPQVSCTF